jgi:type II restriction enzyme
MWANFGLAIQIKHLSLTEELAENIVSSLSTDRIVIICKDAEQKIIVSLLNQIGWKSKIQSVIVESNLLKWYEKALCGKLSHLMGERVLQKLSDEIKTEFPSTDKNELLQFLHKRDYDKLVSERWT